MIDWGAFSWEAFATITTGLAAVAAATIVGFRQLRLIASQNALQARQADYAREASERDYHQREQTLRLALLERRLVVLDDFRGIWTEWIREANLTSENLERLRVLNQSAKLLFSDYTNTELTAVYENIEKKIRFAARARQFERRDPDKAKQYLTQSIDAEEAAHDVVFGLIDKLIAEARVVEVAR